MKFKLGCFEIRTRTGIKNHSIRIFELGNESACYYIDDPSGFDELAEQKITELIEIKQFIEVSLGGEECNAQQKQVESLETRLDQSRSLPLHQDWDEQEIIKQVEDVVDEYLREFLECPFQHRVEHSAHCKLFSMLSTIKELSTSRIAIKDTKKQFETNLIHKEWPEPKAAPGKSRRGSFDLAILPKSNEEISIDEFSVGLITPFLAFEVSLNYGLNHLKKDLNSLDYALDYAKLNGGLNGGYVIHLARETDGPNQDHVKKHIEQFNSKTKIAAAIIRRDGSKLVKFVNGESFQESK